MTTPFIRQICLDGFLSFAPGSTPITLGALNVLIGPNGSGKSNLLEALCLLTMLPRGDSFSDALRAGGGASEWLWKGGDASTIELKLNGAQGRQFDYRIKWAPNSPGAAQATILAESFSEQATEHGHPLTYFRAHGGKIELATKMIGSDGPEPYKTRVIDGQYIDGSRSILSQRSEPESYPDNVWLGGQFAEMAEFREWCFGRAAAPRNAQRTDMPTDYLLPSGSNLAMILQELSHRGRLDAVNAWLRRFLPRAKRLTTRVSGGAILPFLEEDGAPEPIPATRLSDGTLRFIALLVSLLSDPAPPLLCIEEPELGLHPDALSLVAELLVEASERMQLIVTTHSDALVSALTEHVESVLVCEHLGGSQVRRLHADALSHWLGEYRLGDLWRMGELGGNP